MGSSAKRKKEKKKDFQKPKLKVGKAKPKASNFTDTSFAAKSIVLKEQSILSSGQSRASQFAHHLSLLSHPSDTQRKESLSFLTTSLSTSAPATAPPQPTSTILPKLQPLLHDGSNGVRQQMFKLLQALPVEDTRAHVDNLLLWTRAGMTHLAADVRNTSLDVLEWLLQVAGREVVSSAGGWVKTLQCFMNLLGWKIEEQAGKWTAPKATYGRAAGDGKLRVKQLQVFVSFIRAGLSAPASQAVDTDWKWFPLYQTEQHMIPKRPNAYGYLNLFGEARDEENEEYEDREDRQRVFFSRVQKSVLAGIDQARKEGGEMGRAAGSLAKAVKDGMKDFQPQD